MGGRLAEWGMQKTSLFHCEGHFYAHARDGPLCSPLRVGMDGSAWGMSATCKEGLTASSCTMPPTVTPPASESEPGHPKAGCVCLEAD